jgi:hypothetical protein
MADITSLGLGDAASVLETVSDIFSLTVDLASTTGISHSSLPELRRFVDALERHDRIRSLRLIGFSVEETPMNDSEEEEEDDFDEEEDDFEDDEQDYLEEEEEEEEEKDGPSNNANAPDALIERVVDRPRQRQEEEDVEGEEEEEDASAPDAMIERVADMPPLQLAVETELARLFGTVVPNHLSLTDVVYLDGCDSRHVEALASSCLPSRRLDAFSVSYTDLDRRCVKAIAEMIRRNVQLENLWLDFCKLDADGCKRICDSIQENEHLRGLSLGQWFYPRADTFVHALSKRSTLTSLFVRANWSVVGFSSLVECLRANETLEELDLEGELMSHDQAFDYNLVEELLTTYNFTLQRFAMRRVYDDMNEGMYIPAQGWINALLKRNDSVREANAQLQARQYHIGQRSIWPEAMGRVSRMPTLLYRFLRKGNADALAVHMQAWHATKRHGYNLRPRGALKKIKRS